MTDDIITAGPEPAQTAQDGAGRPFLRLIAERRSVRAYLDQPVPRDLVEAVLDAARWAPSGANMQPWKVRVLSGATKGMITRALLDVRAAGQSPDPDYAYYPKEWVEPYKSRRTALGISLYGSEKGRRTPEARQRRWDRNYAFFGAPVGLLFFLDGGLETGSWLDCGMFIQNVMLAARAIGLETCPQVAITDYPSTIRGVLGISREERLVCALSLGYADWGQPINGFERSRAEAAQFTVFHD